MAINALSSDRLATCLSSYQRNTGVVSKRFLLREKSQSRVKHPWNHFGELKIGGINTAPGFLGYMPKTTSRLQSRKGDSINEVCCVGLGQYVTQYWSP